MEKQGIIKRAVISVRQFIGGLGYSVFLWAYGMTQEEHFALIRRDLVD